MWTLEELKLQLKNLEQSGAIKAWSLLKDRECKKEFYLIQSVGEKKVAELDQERFVEAETLSLSIYIKGSSSQSQGKASSQLSRFEPLAPQIEQLILMANNAEEKSWVFPMDFKNSASQPLKLSSVESVGDLNKMALTLKGELQKNISEENTSEFNSAELFCILNQSKLELSSGFISEEIRSKIYSEVCFSYKNSENGKNDEFLVTQSGVHPEQMDMKKLVKASSSGAKNLTHGKLPKSGNYSVVLDSKVLVYLFADVLSHLDASSEYYKMPHSAVGDSFIADYSGHGFELKLNPHVDYATASGLFDSSGLPQKPLSLLKNNKVVNQTINSRMAQYLNKETTSSFGVIEILPSVAVPEKEMYSGEDQVLEIHQFSGLFTSADDLTFSSEIRLAKLIDMKSGEFYWIRGGSLSGNFKENFMRPVWSNKTITENLYDTFVAGSATYKGPEKALIHNVSISS